MNVAATQNRTINIALADDHKLMRETIKSALVTAGSNLNVMLEAENGKDLISKLSRRKPDILLLDIRMPDMNGIEVLKILFEEYPEIKVLILSAFTDEIYVAQCMQYGVYGYLTKHMGIEEVIKAIEMADSNQLYFSNLISMQFARNYLKSYNKYGQDMLPYFSDEELKILDLLKREKSTEEISEIMNLSKRSIELKRDRMREKSNTKTVAGLILYAFKRGIIE